MERKIVLNLAMSLDGYIADENGGFDWLVGDGSSEVDTLEKWDFKGFTDSVDVVVMGRQCYEQGMANDYADKIVYVATSKDLKDHDNIKFMSGDIVSVILDEKKKEGKDIFLFGGGVVIDPFIKADVIDEYIIGYVPTILGSGRKLFLDNNPKIDLKLTETLVNDGIIISRYEKR
ncbi:dihydrofolate reductase family protein [uncultured Clostridium sp.]|jgi:dihydrofolate reductase|uniref:dihydrofolate reductase family protein n=1 Tax=uncultured Clostridium sp. TaxID=59620 RepID=UPI00261B914D|nr:dihydrofolate reductase family protein [uncultured Clostridium sp.]